MNDDEYLHKVLEGQDVAEGSPEHEKLEKARREVESVLRAQYGQSLVLLSGGSCAKGTILRINHDLDLHADFPESDTQAGKTLHEIFSDVNKTLGEKFETTPGRSAIRLRTRNNDGTFSKLGVDVVPGRFVVGNQGDVFIHQNGADKDWLKTNLLKQIEHVKYSGVVPAIRLIKLWRLISKIEVKTFILELLVIEVLKGEVGASVASQYFSVLEAFSAGFAGIAIEDPANPYGNNLSTSYSDDVKQTLKAQANMTLNQINEKGLQSVFGSSAGQSAIADRMPYVAAIASQSTSRSRPWGESTWVPRPG